MSTIHPLFSESTNRKAVTFLIFALAAILFVSVNQAEAAAPAFSSFGNVAASTGADVTVTLPAHQTDDIMLMLGWVRDQNDTVGITTASGWAQVGTGCTSACSASFSRGSTSRYWLFWKRATSSSETNPVFNKSGTNGDTYAAVIVYSGAIASGDPFEVLGSAATGTTDPATITGINTLSFDSLVVVPVGGEDNNNASIITTGTNPSAYTEHYDEVNTGADGAVTFSEAVRTTAGATGNISVNWNSANPVGWGGIALALKPAKTTPTLSVTNSPVTYNGSPQSATVTGSVAGTVSNVKYNGSTTVPTNVATYTITADFTPTDTTNYNSLTGASAGNFIINKATPTLSVTNSPVTYDGATHSATVSCTGGGTVSNISTGGAATQTNAGTYAVTADCAASTNYNAVTGASAGNFVINKATPTLSVTNSPVTYDGSPHAATVSCTGGGTVTNISTGGAATQTNAGTYAVTADCAASTNYNAVTGASAGNFVISMANQTITFGALSNKTLSDPDFTVSATASSGLTVSFSSLTTGVCTVSVATVHLVSTGTCTIRASQAGNSNYNAASNVDQSFTVTAGILDHFAISAIGTQTAGTAFNITITAQDVNNNTLTSYTGTVDLTTTAGTIAPTQSAAFSSGVRTESVTVTQSGAGKTITATDHGGTKTGTSSTFTVNSGALDHFSFAAISTQIAGTAFNITMTAQDANNNTVTGYAGTVDLTTTAGTIAPTQSAAFSSGVRTESVTVTQAGSGKTITATDHAGTKTGTSAAFTVSAGSTASFSLNNPGDMYAKTRLGYTVSRFDGSGNAVGTGTTTVYLYSSSTSGTKKFYDDSLAGSVITSVDIGSGHSSANVWYYDEAPGTYTITASDATPTADGATGIADATDTVTVNPVAVKFVILDPSDGTVDAPIVVTVQAQKPDNSVDTNYQNNVTLATSGSATGGGVVDIINGVGSLNISDTVAETVGLSLTDSSATGLDVSSTQSVVFAGGAIAQFTFNHPATLVAGQRAAYTVTRKDQHGNVSSQGASTVYLYSSSTGPNKKFYDAATNGNVITSVGIPDGQSTASVWYYDTLPGSWTITASDATPTADGNTGINDAVDTLQVVAGPVFQFVIDNPGDMTAGTMLEYTVSREDQFTNPVTSNDTTGYLSSTSSGAAFYDAASGGSVITSLTIPNGQSSASVWYSDSNVGTWTITVSDNASGPDGAAGVADATDSVTVNAAPIVATRFVIEDPTDGTVDAPITVTIKAEDDSGNVDTTKNTGVFLNTNGSATGGGLVTITNGVGTIAISDHTAQTVHLSLTDTQGTGLNVSSAQDVTFAPGAVAQFSLDNPGDVAAGSRIGYSVARKDQYNNAVTTGATTVYLYSTSTGVNKKFYDAASNGSVITSIVIPNGSSSVGFWAYDEKAGNWFISVSDNASAPDNAGIADTSDAIAVQPATTAKFLLNDPGNMTANTRLGYTVTRKDQFDNLVTTGVSLAYLYSSSTGTTTAFYAASSGGAPIDEATINDGSSSSDFWYYDETPGTWLVTASDSSSAPNGSTGIQDAVDSVTVSAIPIVATRFVILPVSTVQIGTPATVTVEAQDDAGNVDTTIQSGVTLIADGSATGAGLVSMVNGVGEITLQDATAETVNLSLSDTQSTHLNVSSTQTVIFSATPVAPARAGVTITPIAPVAVGVRLTGRAFPRAQVQILAVSPEGTNVQGQTIAAANGTFTASLSGVQTGSGAYGLVAVDSLGRTTQTKVFNAKLTSQYVLLNLDNVLLSPTMGLVRPTVRQNDTVGFVGMAVPGFTVRAQVDGTLIPQTALAAADGSYKILFSTGTLSLGSHTVRVQQTSLGGLLSDYTPQKVFTVTNLVTPQTDFNQDGVINVQDWSIFLSRWSSTNTATRMLDDLNGDGKVDVTDLSIFVRTLKQ
ncbi:MAG: MBG domain-containing protein [Minisyncoccia bacterium]